MIRVLLADDQVLVRAGFRALLDAQDDIEVVGEAADGERGGRGSRASTRPTCPDGHPDARRRRPRGDAPDRRRPDLRDVRVIMLTTFDLDEHVFEALGAGASGFLVKDTEPVELLRGVRLVAAGDALLSPGVTRRLIAEFASQRPRSGPAPAELEQLTDREREVVGLVALGLSNEEIAETLVISPATAKTHVSRAMLKVGARDRAQLVVLAYQSGLVVPPRA